MSANGFYENLRGCTRGGGGSEKSRGDERSRGTQPTHTETEVSSAPPAVLLCFHRRTKARRPSLTFHWRLETRPIIGKSQAVCSHREETCCHSRDEFLS